MNKERKEQLLLKAFVTCAPALLAARVSSHGVANWYERGDSEHYGTKQHTDIRAEIYAIELELENFLPCYFDASI